jgi:hypothetical protein
VGAGVGAFLVAFVVYPPHVRWGSHEKWGDVGGWVGAIATFFAVVVALHIAGREDRARRDQRSMEASILASMITHELTMTWDRARQCSAKLAFTNPSRTLGEFHALEPYLSDFRMPETLARVEKLPVLPRDLALNIATALSLRERLAAELSWMRSVDSYSVAGPEGMRKMMSLKGNLSLFADALHLCVEPCTSLAFEGRLTPWHPEFLERLYGYDEGVE